MAQDSGSGSVLRIFLGLGFRAQGISEVQKLLGLGFREFRV